LVEIRRLPAESWKDYRNLRLEALRSDPSAFGSSVAEEEALTEDEWRRRIKNALFAISDIEPVGMIVYVFSTRTKTKHVADIFGVYVSAERRGKGLGTRLLRRALTEIQENRGIKKVRLSVNPRLLPAVQLYKKAGFVVVGRARKELKIGRKFYDMLYMEKKL
jgi:ribosomal protein S18 acetylase RimI-like enzyme